MVEKLKEDKLQFKNWKKMDKKIMEDHRAMSDQEVSRSYKLKVAITHKKKAILRQMEIVLRQKKLLIDQIGKTRGSLPPLNVIDRAPSSLNLTSKGGVDDYSQNFPLSDSDDQED